MARRPLQLLAALALVTGVLGVSTALIAEVREEVLRASPAEPSIDFEPPSEASQGLPIRSFTLLDPAPADLPARERAEGGLRLTGNGTLHLGAGDRIQVAPILLPGSPEARFPHGAEREGARITCPSGCTIQGASRTIEALPNATIVLPPGSTLPAGDAIAPGTTLELPTGSRLELDPIRMDAATEMPLLPGTRILLPTEAGAVPTASASVNVDLPAGTRVEGAGNGTATARKLSELGPEPELRGPPSASLHPTVRITEVPDAIRKGSPFQVRGEVVLPNGTPSKTHPITLYANATKRAPGFPIQIGQVATDDEGRFQATARIDPSRPARPYHLLAKAHAQPEHDPPLSEAWSDPIVPVEAKAQLSLKLPEEEGVQVPLPIQLRLVDLDGAPIPNQTVTATIEGTSWEGSSVTDETGHATIVAPDGLPSPGEWTVSARFQGTEHIDGTSTRTTLEAVRNRIVTPPTIVAPRGTNTTLEGRVLHGDEGAEEVRVTASMPGLQASTRTEPNGTFQLPLPVPADTQLGNHTLELTTDGLTAPRTLVVTVTGQLNLSADLPPTLPAGGTLPLTVQARTDRGDPAAGVPVHAEIAGRARSAITDEDGRARIPLPLPGPSSTKLTLRTPGTSELAGTRQSYDVRVAPFDVVGEPVATIGAATNSTIRLQAGQAPLAREPFHLRGPGGIHASALTNGEGEATLTLTAPASVPPGTRQARIDLPRYNLGETIPLRVLARPSLTVHVLEPGAEGAPVRLEATVEGPEGSLRGIPVTAEAQGAFTARASGVTGPDGRAVLELARPADASGEALITVRAEQTSRTAKTVEVATAQVTAEPFPWWPLLGLVPVAGLAYALWRRRRATEASQPSPGPTIHLTLAETPELPPVWHPGNPVTLELTLVDRDGDPLPERTLTIEGPKGRRTVETDAEGTARIRTPAHPLGTHPYTVRFEGDRAHPATEATLELRTVDYREEIDREYQALRREARRAGLCRPDTTPQELARALGGGEPARRLVALFERADYSQHPVGRSHYERFMKAKEACRPDGPAS